MRAASDAVSTFLRLVFIACFPVFKSLFIRFLIYCYRETNTFLDAFPALDAILLDSIACDLPASVVPAVESGFAFTALILLLRHSSPAFRR